MKVFRGWNIGELKAKIADLPDDMPVMLHRDFEDGQPVPISYRGQIDTHAVVRLKIDEHPYTFYELERADHEGYLPDAERTHFEALVIQNA